MSKSGGTNIPNSLQEHWMPFTSNRDFKDFSLIKQSRLSVMEVDLIYWKKICKM